MRRRVRSQVFKELRTKKALLIGINYKGTSSALNGCINDTLNMRRFLLSHGYSEESITMMNELDSSNTPTKQNMLNAIKKIINDADENTDVLIQYSGHGSHTRDYNNDEEDGQDELLCPLDYSTAGMIYDDELRSIIDTAKKGTRIFFFSDSCHSGSILDLQTSYDIDLSNDDRSKFTARKNTRVKPTESYVICVSGCLDPQTSADYYGVSPYDSSRQYQGAMTNAFLTTVMSLEQQKKRLSYKRVMKGMLLMLKNKFTQVPLFSSGYVMDLEDELII